MGRAKQCSSTRTKIKTLNFGFPTILYCWFFVCLFFLEGLTPKGSFVYLFKIRFEIISFWFSEERPTALKILFSMLTVGWFILEKWNIWLHNHRGEWLQRLLGACDPTSYFFWDVSLNKNTTIYLQRDTLLQKKLAIFLFEAILLK